MDRSYRDILCCNSTRNIDTTLARYDREKNRIIETLSGNPSELIDKIWSADGFLSNDPACMCHAGQQKRYTPYTCPPCVNMGRLIDYDNDKIGKPFLIECGDKVGSTFILISLPVGNTSLVIGKEDKIRAQKFLIEHQGMLKCGTQEISDLTFVQSDVFTNNILVWWIIDQIFHKKGLPYSLPLHTAFICRHKGFLLSESPTLGNYQKLKQKAVSEQWNRYDTCSSICKQLGVILDVLHQNFFSHGNPHIEMLMFSGEDIEHEYGNITVSSNFIMCIVDFSYSSITNDKVRLYPKTERSNIILNYATLNITIENGMFRLSNKTDILFNYIRHAGLPIYSSSFDFYCFIVGLMLDQYFYDSVHGDDILHNAWQKLWLDNEYEIIEKRINQNRKGDPDVVRLLGGLWLKCEVVKIWLSNL